MGDVNLQAPVAVIGYGTAGVNAVIGLRGAGFAGEVRVFSDTSTLPYSPVLTSYYASGEKSFEECFPWSADELSQLGAEVLEACPVTELDPGAHLVRTPRGDFPYSKCVVASGASPVLAGFPADEGFTPLVLRSLGDAERLKAVLEDGACRRVLVCGSSMVALKALEACLLRGKQATLLGRSAHVLRAHAAPEAAGAFERGLEALGVQLRLGQTAASARPAGEGPAGGMRAEVGFSDGSADAFDAVVVAHGVTPNLGFVRPGELEVDGGLVVDDFMRTSDADVYAAGDVAAAREAISGSKRIVGLWKNAAVQGQCAGRAMAAELAGGVPDAAGAYKGALSMNTIGVKNMLFVSCGSMEAGAGRSLSVRELRGMTVACNEEEAPDGGLRLVGFNLVSDSYEEGGEAFDVAAMLTLRIEKAFRG